MKNVFVKKKVKHCTRCGKEIVAGEKCSDCKESDSKKIKKLVGVAVGIGTLAVATILKCFDRQITPEEQEEEVPNGPAFHREHGWYLPNDD